MYPAYATAYQGVEAGPSRPRLDPPRAPSPSELGLKPKKRRRLQFSSELRSNAIQRYNPDGTETVEYLHQQSTQRLKRKWDSIFERFKDAHLQDQDEIYLGNRANGEPIVVVKDRGSLRSLRQSMEFGVFIKDEELQGWKDRPEAREMQEQEDEYEDEFDPPHAPIHPSQLVGASSSESEQDEDDPATNDPDLREFLQAEARRKAMLGRPDEGNGEGEEEDEVIDFGHPMWNTYEPAQVAPKASPKPSTTARRPDRSNALPRATPDAPDLITSSSEDENDSDIATVHSDSDEELIDSVRTKRQNIEELLKCTAPFETLPYNDIFGLADLLKISDNTSRLYVDLVSDDDDEEEKIVKVEKAAVEAIEVNGSLPSSTRGEPGIESSDKIDVIEISSSLPTTSPLRIVSSLPNSSIVADATSSPLSEMPCSRGSSVVAVAPPSLRALSPSRTSSPLGHRSPSVHSSDEQVAEIRLPSSFPSMQSTQPSQSHAREATPPAASFRDTPKPATLARTISDTPAQVLPRRESHSPIHTPSCQLSIPDRHVASSTPLSASPFKLPTSTSAPLLTSDSSSKRDRQHHSSTSSKHRSSDRPTKHRSHRHSSGSSTGGASHRNSRFEEPPHSSDLDSTNRKSKKRKCGGPGQCKKTFCLECASALR
ncbi:hypothetical protein PHSY_002354 [Pseudozyma hubeiensis SY62]|uniref:Uncharacterized protein n=1 Tax=Pseudozyma hubeiensis (strain SY62) TaxID=1305764 RepID=R9P0T4_PSEHS|nr:hypothetical protein PHSY_002354 [Pseudozyma hubeiensis SY62]GAC94781.1 hypothetical protein PHSY_002354 [Pseudozyma hubeiensis SY62]